MSCAPINVNLMPDVQRLLLLTPAYVLMRLDATLQNWSTELRKYGEREELRPLAGALDYLASNPFVKSDMGTILDTLDRQSADLELRVLVNAADIAMTATTTPYANFMLAWASLCLWILSSDHRKEDLISDRTGGSYPNGGWARIPAACVELAAALGGLHGARRWAELSWEVIETNRRRHPFNSERLRPYLESYRRLLQTIDSAHRKAVANFVDDIREACEDPNGRARRLVCALLWTLGLVPECFAIHAAAGMPGRRVLTLAVESSIGCVQRDPLLQYIWLEMKNVSSIDLRSHQTLYTVINHDWGQWRLDDWYRYHGFLQPASRLYVLALESLFVPGTDSRAADEFLRVYDYLYEFPDIVPSQAYIWRRFHILRHLIGERFDYYTPDITAARQAEMLNSRINDVSRVRERLTHDPVLPDMLTRGSHACFSLIEALLDDGTALPFPERDRCGLVIGALETFRAAALSYWLRVNPPLPVFDPGAEPARLMDEEKRMLEDLRGAFFLTLRPTLPMHFLWSEMDQARLHDLSDPERRQQFYSADNARHEMEEIEGALRTLATRMRSALPQYAEQRLNPAVNFDQLAELLNRHAAPSAKVSPAAGT